MNASSRPPNLDEALIVVFQPDEAVALHNEINRLPYIPTELRAMKDLLNEYTGLDERSC